MPYRTRKERGMRRSLRTATGPSVGAHRRGEAHGGRRAALTGVASTWLGAGLRRCVEAVSASSIGRRLEYQTQSCTGHAEARKAKLSPDAVALWPQPTSSPEAAIFSHQKCIPGAATRQVFGSFL
jgi:hypothetical protein